MSDKPDVVVVGGGIVGCWTAWYLLQSGCQVTIVDRDRIGSGASWGNCGYICPSHVHPLCGPGAIVNGIKTMARFGGALSIPPRFDPALWSWLIQFARHCNAKDFRNASLARHALLQSSRNIYTEFGQSFAAEIGLDQRGLLLVYRKQADFERYQSSVDELRSEFDIRVDRYEGRQLTDLEPALRDHLAGGWHFPDDMQVSPASLIETLRHQIESVGGVICENATIASLERNGSTLKRMSTVDGQRFTADSFVVATGAEGAVLGSQLGCPIPVVPGKGYSVTVDAAPGLPKIPMIFEDDHVAVTHFGNSFRMGSTMQLTGFSRTVPIKRIELLKRSTRRHLGVELPVGREQVWSGWRPMMPDGIPCIDRSPLAKNVVIATGSGMIGIASGAATGRLTAELVLQATPHVDPFPYRIARFNR